MISTIEGSCTTFNLDRKSHTCPVIEIINRDPVMLQKGTKVSEECNDSK